ncbi:hypothetical protein CspeluHIS016_0602360 [Cutaneotrichosporon spelunceum]|uniref:Uncharacterized protein n=1 Tax=Cutaneotrichosporon spelunceum TaxID=1672016 RepID=A0AAD3YEA2_9TREE|nr:hypothetical protein CspeluHIS016_0602360 [Cutaneotrichosporon spelunceum]
MSFRLALRVRPARVAPTLVRAYAKPDGGDPGTGKWETKVDHHATESEADVRADSLGHNGPPSRAMQDATAAEAEKEAHKNDKNEKK